MPYSDKYLTRSETEFQRIVGLQKQQFSRLSELLYKHTKDCWSSRGRQDSKFSLADKLLITLRYLRDYPTFLVLGNEFEISESYAYKIFTKVSLALVQILKLPKLDNLNLETIIIDVTEQETERPQKNRSVNTQVNKKLILTKL